jgi:hypothetical protein
MIVCSRCKLWAHESECEPDDDNSGKIVRHAFRHKDGCPVKQEVYTPQPNLPFGDD